MISRALVAILLMMNLGVVAWWSLREPSAVVVAADRSLQGVPRLLLLSERSTDSANAPAALVAADAEPAPAPPSSAPQPAAEPPAASLSGPASPLTPTSTDASAAAPANIECFSIGPFQAVADLRRVSAALEPALQSQQMRETKGIEARGYRVYLPAFPSRQQALETARALEERGLRDYYIVTAGAGENTVSLGLFRELSNAEARRDEVRGYGYEAILEPRNEQVTRYWLDIAARADSSWRERAGTFPGTHVESMACE